MQLLYEFVTPTALTGMTEASGYEIENAAYNSASDFNWHKPWKEWRSTVTTATNININLGIESCTCLVVIGANWDDFTLEGVSYSLEKNDAKGDYRGFFVVPTVTGLANIVIGAASPDEGYFKATTILVGDAVTFTRQPSNEITKELMLPRSKVVLHGGATKFGTLMSPYHRLTFEHKVLSISMLNEIRDMKRAVGRDEPFILYDNLGEVSDVYLVRRVDDFSYSEKGPKQIYERTIFEEIG